MDKCNGYVFAAELSNPNEDMFQCAVKAESAYENVADIQERIVQQREAAAKRGPQGAAPVPLAPVNSTYVHKK